MDKFKTHYLKLPVNERESLAQQAGTTRGTLNQVVYGGKQIELGLADCLVALCAGIDLDDLPLTERAQRQRVVREGVSAEAAPERITPEPTTAGQGT
jgi:hypothetical protein